MSGFLSHQSLKNILFLDIETVSLYDQACNLPPRDSKNWLKKAQQFTRSQQIEDKELELLYKNKAGIFAEFSKVICISVGFFTITKKAVQKIRVKSFYGEDETEILLAFKGLLNEHFNKPASHFLCGHNLREFDLPFLCRRMLINKVELPKLLKLSGKKPWQISHVLDTLDLWRFGDFKHYISLDLLASNFGIPSPKDDIDGSMVHDVYWKEKDLPRIVKYCEKDVFVVSQLLLRLNGMHDTGEIEFVSTTKY